MINKNLFFILLLTDVFLYALATHAQNPSNKDYILKMALSQLNKKDVRLRLFAVNEIPKEVVYKHVPMGLYLSRIIEIATKPFGISVRLFLVWSNF